MDKIVHKIKLTTLMYFSDLRQISYLFKTTKDSEIFLSQLFNDKHNDPLGQYQVVLGKEKNHENI
ncbi:unnamed protein product [Onchocerca flexuosa]|uniref:KTSC domain-containing protein n=1 Tax=Onchocerca flexuosa TaxID=387005 RepID=A0A183HQA0_9BILA|nr:unnamed protein product [Onchocerca flexuosa]